MTMTVLMIDGINALMNLKIIMDLLTLTVAQDVVGISNSQISSVIDSDDDAIPDDKDSMSYIT